VFAGIGHGMDPAEQPELVVRSLKPVQPGVHALRDALRHERGVS
jgi:hypothetical protein